MPTIFIYPNETENIKSLVKIKYDRIEIGNPTSTPFECRMTNQSYLVSLFTVISVSIGEEHFNLNLSHGNIPLMALSEKCLLK